MCIRDRLDTIVRNEIWRLRSKLSTYYDGEGKGNPLRIGFRSRSLEPVAQYRSEGTPSATRSSPVHLLRRVAVLPFVAIGPQDEAFNDGLATEVMVRLGARSDLQIISRTSSFAFKGQNCNCLLYTSMRACRRWRGRCLPTWAWSTNAGRKKCCLLYTSRCV